ncbi:Zinc finger C2H2-type [Sesbania bispinosa]|nr:Zinc finger C2H2-type [Sesbania bispinosa]
MTGISIAHLTAAAITTTGTCRPRRRPETGIGTSSAAAAPALPTATAAILRRRGALLLHTSARVGAVPAAVTDPMTGGYQNGISDMESNRGYADLPSGSAQRYQEYRSEYISTQKRAYFNAHKDEEWLKDKYHPTNLLTVIERRNENARQLAKDFLLDLQSGTLDLNPGLSASSSSKSGQASEPNSEEEADTGGKRRRHGRGSNKENDFSAAPKAHPVSSEPRRIQADIQQAQALVRKLDTEKGIQDNVLCSNDHNKNDDKAHSGSVGPIIIIRGLTSVKGLEGVELLDTLITYLWRIHGVDYYGMIETIEAKGFRHARPEGTGHEETGKSGSEWEKKLDSFWQGRLNGQDPLEVMTAKEKIDAAAVEVLDPYVRKIRDEKYGWKYGCGAKGCTKLFHAAEFVYKHLKLKHPELVLEQTSKVREDLYFQNYMNDPDAPGGKPVMQQPQKDKPLKRRLGIEGRLRDDRGNRRDHDRSDRINDGDRPAISPSRERSKALEMGNQDETMYDTYAGPGVPPFTSDMPPPPPVLMPVPGAGPLGPFVPAPPEVAMQMLREQGGGPSSYDASGRKMRSGPHMGGPAPIIAVPPAFRPDPRRMRSYQDLDAPEDEVTVIDYRSL